MKNSDLSAKLQLADFFRDLSAGSAGLAGAVDNDKFALRDFEHGIRFHFVRILAGIEIPQDGIRITVFLPFISCAGIYPKRVLGNLIETDFVGFDRCGIAERNGIKFGIFIAREPTDARGGGRDCDEDRNLENRFHGYLAGLEILAKPCCFWNLSISISVSIPTKQIPWMAVLLGVIRTS